MKDILLKLGEEDYRRLEWISEKLNISISECIRSFIPKIEPPDTKTVVGESEIAGANPNDLIPIAKRLQDKDLKQLNSILNEMKEKGWGATLANEIRQQIIHNKSEEKFLKVGTYKRLSRWITPYRWSKREQYVKPRAEQISAVLFGRGISRID